MNTRAVTAGSPEGERSAALVTGASRGIGLGIAQGLARAGHDLTITARDAELLEKTADDLRSWGVRVHPVAGDMADEDDVRRIAAARLRRDTAVPALSVAVPRSRHRPTRPASVVRTAAPCPSRVARGDIRPDKEEPSYPSAAANT
ncbi:SDR family NAD(P)-dependent oxidoreductase [Streptomyces viridosporus]|uniref:SDR family NAD(P)-dependent oxidoreductase n=1 Tax=Streptomyces viridosporus TaxID=67581 RepID=UPI003418CDD9